MTRTPTWSTVVHGKCILSGEHAVLRGIPALVVPVKSRELKLQYEKVDCAFRVESVDATSEPTKVVMWGVIEKALSQLDKSFSDLRGVLKAQNSIPFGAGLGASAALCVAVARFFRHLSWVGETAVFEFARSLENMFHGESSGVDVAVAELSKPIKYLRGQGFQEIKPLWQPRFFLSYSGHKGVTSECVAQVKRLSHQNPQLGEKLDKKMGESVRLFEAALTDSKLQGSERETTLIKAIDLARSCFESWGLTRGNLEQHMNALRELGARACKPTGSGGGGYVLSYWTQEPPAELLSAGAISMQLE